MGEVILLNSATFSDAGYPFAYAVTRFTCTKADLHIQWVHPHTHFVGAADVALFEIWLTIC